MNTNLLWYLMAFLSGYILTSFGIFWAHRLMHMGFVHVKGHIEHHRKGTGQGWFGEFTDYMMPGLIVYPLIAAPWYFHSLTACICSIIASIMCTAFCAFTHETSHFNPNLIFWAKRPIHFFHHKNSEWNTNFGLTTIFWDKLFGTYKDDPEWKPQKFKFRELLKVKW